MPNVSPRLISYRYQLLEVLGQGGQGRLWRARDEYLHRFVAVKELVAPVHLTAEEHAKTRERSLREARAIAQLDHPNVVRVFDVVSQDGQPWIVMELVNCRSLHEVLINRGALPPSEAAGIGLALLSALRAAHQAGIMHRDVKPANVLIADDGRVLLTDFGLATSLAGDSTVTRTGVVVGSPSFLPPERINGERGDQAADLWALGATLFTAVEGRPVFVRPSPAAIMAALLTEEPPAPQRAGALTPLIEGLLRRDPAARLTADQAEELLVRALSDGDGGPAAAPAADAAATISAPITPAAGSATRTGSHPHHVADTDPNTADRAGHEAQDRNAAAPVAASRRRRATRPVLAALATLVAAGGAAGFLTLTRPSEPAPATLSDGTGRGDPSVTTSGLGTTDARPTASRVAPPAVRVSPTSAASPSRPIVAVPTASVPPPPATAGYQGPVVGLAGKCLDVAGASPADGTPVVLYTCNRTKAQIWTIGADGTLRALGRCLDVRDGVFADGTRIQVWQCNPASPNQRWSYNSSTRRFTNTTSGKCLDVTDQSGADGTPLQIWSCNPQANQRWTLSAS